jgi:hypothetical protein
MQLANILLGNPLYLVFFHSAHSTYMCMFVFSGKDVLKRWKTELMQEASASETTKATIAPGGEAVRVVGSQVQQTHLDLYSFFFFYCLDLPFL